MSANQDQNFTHLMVLVGEVKAAVEGVKALLQTQSQRLDRGEDRMDRIEATQIDQAQKINDVKEELRSEIHQDFGDLRNDLTRLNTRQGMIFAGISLAGALIVTVISAYAKVWLGI